MSLGYSVIPALRRLIRRVTADYAFRIRHCDGLFEIQERSQRGWRVRGVFLDYDAAERTADAMVRERRRPGRPRRRLGAAEEPVRRIPTV